jgi:hypothetical protein
MAKRIVDFADTTMDYLPAQPIAIRIALGDTVCGHGHEQLEKDVGRRSANTSLSDAKTVPHCAQILPRTDPTQL